MHIILWVYHLDYTVSAYSSILYSFAYFAEYIVYLVLEALYIYIYIYINFLHCLSGILCSKLRNSKFAHTKMFVKIQRNFQSIKASNKTFVFFISLCMFSFPELYGPFLSLGILKLLFISMAAITIATSFVCAVFNTFFSFRVLLHIFTKYEVSRWLIKDFRFFFYSSTYPKEMP